MTMQGGNKRVCCDFWVCRRCTFHNNNKELTCLCCSAPKQRDSAKKKNEKPSLLGRKRKGSQKQGQERKRGKRSSKEPQTTPVPTKKVN